MNARASNLEDQAAARDEAWRLLQLTIHYARCAQMHLEVDDDAVALYDLGIVRQYFISAIRAFEPLKQSFQERVAAAEACK